MVDYDLKDSTFELSGFERPSREVCSNEWLGRSIRNIIVVKKVLKIFAHFKENWD